MGWGLRTGLGMGAAPRSLVTFHPAVLEALPPHGVWAYGICMYPEWVWWVPGWERGVCARALGTQ